MSHNNSLDWYYFMSSMGSDFKRKHKEWFYNLGNGGINKRRPNTNMEKYLVHPSQYDCDSLGRLLLKQLTSAAVKLKIMSSILRGSLAL